MIKLIKGFILFALFTSFSIRSFCWGVLGHRIVGQIAYSYLTPKAKKAVQQILGNETIAMSGNWADFIKSDSAYSYLSTWHYIDFDPGLDRSQLLSYLSSDTAVDLYTKMKFVVAELKNRKLPPAKKKMYLRLLIHLVGDAHQPLHVGQREDLGGNKIKVSWFNNPVNLHTVWDESLVNFQQLSYTEYTNAINHTTLKQRLAWQKQPIRDWIIESYQISQKLYGEITQPEPKLGYRYNYDHIEILNEQLIKAGVRLAGLLNQLFG